MFPYIGLIGIAAIFSYIAVKKNINGGFKICIGKSVYVYGANIAIYMFFFALFVLMALRDVTIGRDLHLYKQYFEIYSQWNINRIFYAEGDKLYILLNWIVGKITNNYQIFLTIVAFITLLPLTIQYSKDRRHSFLKIILFMNMPIFIMFFSGLRQSLAISIGLIAYEYVKRKQVIPFFLSVIIAIGFHHSAFILFFLYPIYYIKIKKENVWLIAVVFAIVLRFNKQIFGMFTSIAVNVLGEQYEMEMSFTGAYTMLFLFILFVVMAYVLPDEKRITKDVLGLRNYLVFALLLQCFAPVQELAMRMNYYFIIFIPMIIPKIICFSKRSYRGISRCAEVIMILFFLSYYLINTYNSCVTGVSTLDTYPYLPFW